MFDGFCPPFQYENRDWEAPDSTADLFFFLSSAWFIYALYTEYFNPNLILFFIFMGVWWRPCLFRICCGKVILMHTFQQTLRNSGIFSGNFIIFL